LLQIVHALLIAAQEYKHIVQVIVADQGLLVGCHDVPIKCCLTFLENDLHEWQEGLSPVVCGLPHGADVVVGPVVCVEHNAGVELQRLLQKVALHPISHRYLIGHYGVRICSVQSNLLLVVLLCFEEFVQHFQVEFTDVHIEFGVLEYPERTRKVISKPVVRPTPNVARVEVGLPEDAAFP